MKLALLLAVLAAGPAAAVAPQPAAPATLARAIACDPVAVDFVLVPDNLFTRTAIVPSTLDSYGTRFRIEASSPALPGIRHLLETSRLVSRQRGVSLFRPGFEVRTDMTAACADGRRRTVFFETVLPAKPPRPARLLVGDDLFEADADVVLRLREIALFEGTRLK